MTMQVVESSELEKYLTKDSAVKVTGSGIYDGKSYREIKVIDNNRNQTIELRVFELENGGIQLPMNFANSGLS